MVVWVWWSIAPVLSNTIRQKRSYFKADSKALAGSDIKVNIVKNVNIVSPKKKNCLFLSNFLLKVLISLLFLDIFLCLRCHFKAGTMGIKFFTTLINWFFKETWQKGPYMDIGEKNHFRGFFWPKIPNRNFVIFKTYHIL